MAKHFKILLIPILLFTTLLLQGCKDNVLFDIKQVNEEQLIEIEVYGEFTSFDVEVSYNDTILFEESYNSSQTNVIVDGVYGYNEVKVTTYSDKTINSTIKKVGLSASEYNIAPLNATMPVTLFSVELNEISKQAPTFVMLERASAYNWDALPDNVYKIPGFENEDLNGIISGEVMHPIVYDWIKDLYEINPNSFFNVYYNDVWLSAALQVLKGNDIPTENYHLYLLSDGTGTSTCFNEFYNVENPYEVYDELLGEYNEFISKIKIKNDNDMYNNHYVKFLYTIVTEEENVEYWATRIEKAYFSKDEDFQNEIINHPRMIAKNLSSTLSSLTEEEQTSLKNLFNFSESFFEEAETNTKKVMLILGTWDQNEVELQQYVAFLQTYYGDEYVYYYKGHPFTPTHLVDGKEEFLNNMGLIDIDSTIPAELILFFNPEVYCSGYSSTTLESVDEDKVLCIFGEYITANDNYIEKIDVRIENFDEGVYLLTFKDGSTAYFYFDNKEIVY